MNSLGAVLSVNTFDGPDEREAYTERSTYFATVHPTNGGFLEADGELTQSDDRTDWSFPQELPGLARSYGQSYYPVINNIDVPSLEALWDDPSAWPTAFDNIIDAATTRFDAPWDGVLWDLEGADASYENKASAFYNAAYPVLSAAGLRVYGWFPICIKPHTPTLCIHPIDWAALNPAFDQIQLGLFFGGAPHRECTVTPMWWLEMGLQHVIDLGIPATKLAPQLTLMSKWTDGVVLRDIGYPSLPDEVLTASWEWFEQFDAGAWYTESTVSGAVREWKVDLLDGRRFWLEDARTLRLRLALIDSFGVNTCTVFRPATAHPSDWAALAEWRRGGCLNANEATRVWNPDDKEPCRTALSRPYAIWNPPIYS